MARIAVVDPEAPLRAGHPFPTVAATGGVEAAMRSPEDAALQLCRVALARGATLSWHGHHGDEGVYVLRGAVSVDGRIAPAGGAVVVEAGVAATLTAVEASLLVHVRNAATPALSRGVQVHVLGPAGWAVSGRDAGIEARWFADSTCATCSISLLHVRHDGPDRRVRAHSHSADEIIHMLGGSILLGRRVLRPGASLCIPGGVRYAFVGGPHGYAYLNYRAAASSMTFEPHSAPLPEGGVALGGEIVADVR